MARKSSRLSARAAIAAALAATLSVSVMIAPAGATTTAGIGMVANNFSRTATAFDLASGAVRGSAPAHWGGVVGDCVITSSGLGLVTGFGGRVTVVDAAATPTALASGVNSIAISNPGEDIELTADERFAIITDGGSYHPISVVSVADRAEVSATPIGGTPTAVDVAPDGSVLVADYYGDRLIRYTLSAAGVLSHAGQAFTPASGNVYASPSGMSAVALDDWGGTISVHALPSLARVQVFNAGYRPIAAAFSPDGTRLFVRHENFTRALIMDPERGVMGSTWSISTPVIRSYFGIDQIAVSPDGSKLYIPTESGGLRIVNAGTGAVLDTISHPSLSGSTGVCLQTTSNQAPVAVDDASVVEEDGQVAVDVLGNDTDADGDTLSVTAVTDPAFGFATIGADGRITYEPDADTNGVDTFDYTVSDGRGGTDTGTVTMTVTAVNDAPVATDDATSTDEDTEVTIDVLVNDSDADGDSLTVTGTTDPANGSATVNADETITYVPDADTNGIDTFDYTVSDGNGGTDTATVTVTGGAVNDAPVFALPASPDQSVLEDAGAQTVPAFATSIAPGPSDEASQTVTFDLTTDNDALFDSLPSIDEATGDLTYTSAADAFGSATVTVTLSDDGGTANGGDDESDARSFEIAVGNVNDTPTFTPGEDITLDEDAGAQSLDWATGVSPGPNESDSVDFEIVTNDNPALFSAGPSITDGGDVEFTSAPNAFGTANLTVKLTDDGGTANGGDDESDSVTLAITVNPVNDAPVVVLSAAAATADYSDAIATVTGTVTDVDNRPSELTLDAVTFPNDLALSNIEGSVDDEIGDPLTFDLGGTIDVAPGSYTATVRATDPDGATGEDDLEVEVTPEDATATYIGDEFVMTPGANSDTALVDLRATIKDGSVAAGSTDTASGNVSNATVTFTVNGIPVCSDEDVALVDASNPTSGVASCGWEADLGSSDSEQYTVGVEIGGYYTGGTASAGLVTVAKPLARNFLTGGGHTKEISSAGTYTADEGSKIHFGFSLQYNSKMTNLRGKGKTIFESNGRRYMIKSNSTDTLTVQAAQGKATFKAKAELIDVTDEVPVTIAGNLTMIVEVTDNGEPGRLDTVGISLYKKNALWFSSRWNGTRTAQQALTGGNLYVR